MLVAMLFWHSVVKVAIVVDCSLVEVLGWVDVALRGLIDRLHLFK